MPQKEIDCQKIRANGWKQGSFLRVDHKAEIFILTQCNQEKLPEGLYIVLSQDCDIVNRELTKEPAIELIRADEITTCAPDCTHCKNPRELHFDLITHQGKKSVKCLPYSRYWIARSKLECLKPDAIQLEKDPLRILIRWITKRYTRPGFPDAFNQRLRVGIKKIKKLLESIKQKKTLGLFARLHSEKELISIEPYKIILIMLVNPELDKQQDELLEIKTAFDEILFLFEGIKGIEIIEASVQSLDEISVYQYQLLKQIDFDYLSGIEGRTIHDDISVPSAILAE